MVGGGGWRLGKGGGWRLVVVVDGTVKRGGRVAWMATRPPVLSAPYLAAAAGEGASLGSDGPGFRWMDQSPVTGWAPVARVTP